MDLQHLEQIFKLMRKHKVQELETENCHIKLFDDFEDQPSLSPEMQKALNKIEEINSVSDEDIMFNPYAGMGEENV